MQTIQIARGLGHFGEKTMDEPTTGRLLLVQL